MKAYAVMQALVIALIVAWSAGYALRRLLPTASRRVQARVATWLEQSTGSTSLRQWAHALQPVQRQSGGCGSSGCSTCGACAPASNTSVADAQPLIFHPRAKP